VALGFSVLISAEIVVLFAGSYGFGAYAQQITALPQTGYTWLVGGSPELQTVMSKLDTMRVHLRGDFGCGLDAVWLYQPTRQTDTVVGSRKREVGSRK
jgi:hypothetical protein